MDSLGGVLRHLGRLDEAQDHLATAMALAVATDNRYAQIATMAKLATVHAIAGRYEEARRCAEEGAACAQGFGARLRQADGVNALGIAHAAGGDYRDAVDCHSKALRLAEGTAGRQYVEALIGLATAYTGLDRWPQAQRPATRAAEMAAATGQAALEGSALTVLARIHFGLGAPAAAGEYARRALALHRMPDRRGPYPGSPRHVDEIVGRLGARLHRPCAGGPATADWPPAARRLRTVPGQPASR